MQNTIHYQTAGVCSSAIDLEIIDGVISKAQIIGGCPGNTVGLSRMVIGRKPEEVIALLKGIRCGLKPTSCPDQMAKALEAMLAE